MTLFKAMNIPKPQSPDGKNDVDSSLMIKAAIIACIAFYTAWCVGRVLPNESAPEKVPSATE